MLLRQTSGDQLSQRLPILPWHDSEQTLWHEGLRRELGKHSRLPEIRVRVDHDLWPPLPCGSMGFVWSSRISSRDRDGLAVAPRLPRRKALTQPPCQPAGVRI